MHLAPDGFRIRLMEPGEAPALRALARAAGLFRREPPDMPDFVRWLLQHEIFVAEAEGGGPVGFAAARDATDLYWLSGLAIDPSVKGRGIRKALLAAVLARAGWFFHRAVGLCVDGGEAADWYRRRRFLGVERGDETETLAALRTEAPGCPQDGSAPTERDVAGDALVGSERIVMIHWL